MFPALLTTLFWAMSAVCGTRSATLMGGTEANFWRLTCATLLLGLWAHLFGQGLSGASFPLFFVSGIVGIGADVFLFQSYPRLGSRLTILIIQCGAALCGALLEWLWQGTKLTGGQIAAGATILAGVALALAPGKHLTSGRRQITAGIVFSVMGAIGNGCGAVLTRQACRVAAAQHEYIDAATGAYQRLLGGMVVAVICLVIVWGRRRIRHIGPADSFASHRAAQWGRAWPWVLANAVLGQTLGVTCYQWALKTTPAGLVLAIVSTAPLVIIPFSSAMEGEKMTRRSILGGLLAVIGAIALVTVTTGK